MNRNVRSVLFALLAAAPLTCGAVDLEAYLKKDTFTDIKISPAGDYLAAIVPYEDRTGLVIMRRADNQLTAQFQMERNSHVETFDWVNDTRVLISMSEKIGDLEQPRSHPRRAGGRGHAAVEARVTPPGWTPPAPWKA